MDEQTCVSHSQGNPRLFLERQREWVRDSRTGCFESCFLNYLGGLAHDAAESLRDGAKNAHDKKMALNMYLDAEALYNAAASCETAPSYRRPGRNWLCLKSHFCLRHIKHPLHFLNSRLLCQARTSHVSARLCCGTGFSAKLH